MTAVPQRVRFVDQLSPSAETAEWQLLRWTPWMPDPVGVIVTCPWCGARATAFFKGTSLQIEPRSLWDWNGDRESPTLSPSFASRNCPLHIWVKDGQIINAGTPPHGPRGA